MKRGNRLFAILLAIAMVATYMPAMAFATGDEDPSSESRGEPTAFSVSRDGGFTATAEYYSDGYTDEDTEEWVSSSPEYLQWSEPTLESGDEVEVTYENGESIAYTCDGEYTFTADDGEVLDASFESKWTNEQSYENPFVAGSDEPFKISGTFYDYYDADGDCLVLSYESVAHLEPYEDVEDYYDWDAYVTGTDYSDADVYLEDSSGEKELSVTAEYNDEGNASYKYQWATLDDTAGDAGEYVDIEGATKALYTAKQVGVYRCRVTLLVDGKEKDSRDVEFYVFNWKILNDDTRVNFKYGEKVTLTVKTDYAGTDMTYQWFIAPEDEDESLVKLEGETNASYTPELNKEGAFVCCIKADNQTQYAKYEAYIDKSGYDYVVTYPNATATISTADGRDLTINYNGYKDSPDVNFPEEGDYVTISNNDGGSGEQVKYVCDGYRNLVSSVDNKEYLYYEIVSADPETGEAEILFSTDEVTDHEKGCIVSKYSINMTIEAEVTTTVSSIRFEPSNITLNAEDIKVEEDGETYYDFGERSKYVDEDGETCASCFAEGDKLIVSYNDDRKDVTFVCSPEDDYSFVASTPGEGQELSNIDPLIDNTILNIGNNTVTLFCMGKTTEINVVVVATGDDEVEAVIEKINDLPEADSVSSSDKAAISAARTAYDALSNDQKAKISEEVINKLIEAEAALKDAEDAEAAELVINMINELPAKSEVTTADKDAIEAVRAAYDALTKDQKNMIGPTTFAKLTEAEAALKEAEDLAAADAVIAKIDALPTTVATADKAAIEAARAAYNALTDDQKAKVSEEILGKLTAAEAALKEAEDQAAADAVIAKIDALPTTVATADKAAIEAARAAYDALTDAQKEKVSAETLAKLTDAEAALKDAEVVEPVIEKINALPAKEDVTTANKAAIEAARKAYDALTDAQKAKVDATKLTEAEAALDAAIEAEDKEKADAVIAKIDALPANITTANKTAIEEARAAYNALTDAQKEKVSAETLAKLTDAEAALKDAEVVEPVIEKINALPAKEDVTTANKAAIEAARKAYDALTDAQKAIVDAATLAKLTDAESALDAAIEAEDQAAADAVITKINALPAKDDVTTANKEAIEAARKAYDALTEAQKAKVDATTLAKLTDAETALKAAIDAEDEAAAEAVKNKIDALPASVTTADRAAIEEARAAYNALTDAQKDKVSTETLAKLTDAEAALREAQNEENRRAEEARRAAQPKEIQDLPVVKITKPKAGKKKATVKWKKVTKKNLKKIQGIEIQVATDPGFNQIVKSATAGKKKKSKTIKGLKPKTTYWVRIRAFRNAADGKHVSAWKVKKVKIKK